MGEVTVGQIAAGLALVAGVIGSLTAILKWAGGYLSRWHEGVMKAAMEPVVERLDKLDGGLESVKMENCKNYIVNFLSKVEAGDRMTGDAKMRFYENYDLYQSLGGNSYIHEWVDRLKKEGKI